VGDGRGRSHWAPSIAVVVLKLGGANLLQQRGSLGGSSISCCPHCSCFSPDFILWVYDRCRSTQRTEKPCFHPSCCSHRMLRRVCPHRSTRLRMHDALPPAGAAPDSLHCQVGALSCSVRRKSADLGDLFPSVLLMEPAWSEKQHH